MEAYGIFYVATARPRPGKGAAAAKWWREEGQAIYASIPGVESLRTLAGQFGLAGKFGLEFWYEVENYAVMDQWDEVIAADPETYGPVFTKFNELFESGPSRLMGDWPESRLTD